MNSLGSSSEIVQNKLIILYMIDKLNMPVGNNALTRLVLEPRLMNYFMLQQCFNELCESKLLRLHNPAPVKSRDGSAGPESSGSQEGYVLTDSGRQTLQYFLNLLPPGLKKRLDKLASESRGEIRMDSLVSADFIPESENKFTVLCRMEESGFPLIELKAAAGTKKDARGVCENWKKHSAAIYAEIMEALTKKRD
jgi:hypothetical protein